MATEKWIAGSGVGLTWTNAFTGTVLNSIANGNAIISDLQIDNSAAFDIFCDVSFIGASITTAAPNFISIYFYPFLDDASSYGDGRFASSAAGPPPGNYMVGTMGLPVGTQAPKGAIRGIILPPGRGKFLLYNQAGAALASSGNTLKYRTYNRSIA